MQNPVCRYFRAKRMFIPGQEGLQAPAAGDNAHHSGHCWCNQTLSPVGRDGNLAGSVRCCDQQRRCYEQLFPQSNS